LITIQNELHALFLYNNKNVDNKIFDKNYNSDGLKDPWIKLRDEFASNNIKLTAENLNNINSPLFRLFLDYPQIEPDNYCPNYLVQAESAQVYPKNKKLREVNPFVKVFTWDDSLIDNIKYIKCNLGNRLQIIDNKCFNNREFFCSMLAANKALPLPYHADYYLERHKTIKWFEKNAFDDFVLYGSGWNLPGRKPGILSKVVSRVFNKTLPKKATYFHPSWRGIAKTKSEVLTKSKFTIAYENVGDLSGYITEKIFDAFVNGCVPVYWGASNVEGYIPNSCFVDRRDFKSNADLYNYLKSIDARAYAEYQLEIAQFLKSPKSIPFSVESFANTIVSTIVRDLNL
jgi:alpha(1,3/1,4) fucosyltransferase